MSNTKTITALNSKFLLVVPGVFPMAQELEGYAADNAYSFDDVNSVEVRMGVDGKASFGLLPFLSVQNITLQPNSKSLSVFNLWAQAQILLKEVITANGIVTLTSIKQKYILSNGALSGFKPVPDVKKLIEPVSFKITWETIVPIEF